MNSAIYSLYSWCDVLVVSCGAAADYDDDNVAEVVAAICIQSTVAMQSLYPGYAEVLKWLTHN